MVETNWWNVINFEREVNCVGSLRVNLRCLIFKLFLSSWGIGGCGFDWNMQNAFTFDSQVGVRKYVVRLIGLLLWQLTLREKSRNLNHEERELCKVIYHHIHHLNWRVGWHWVWCRSRVVFRSLEVLHTYIHTYITSNIHNIHTYIHTYIHNACMHAYIHT